MYWSKKIIIVLCALCCIYVNQALAESKEDFINHIAGVYKYSDKINFYEGPGANPQYSQYTMENILEIIPYNNEAVYFRIKMYFDNAHGCGISGIANVINKKSELEYKPNNKQCILNIKFSNSKITFIDPKHQCADLSCGARGSYDRTGQFEMKQRRKIRYIPVIMRSEEYEKAVDEYENKDDNSDNATPNDLISKWKVPEFELHK